MHAPVNKKALIIVWCLTCMSWCSYAQSLEKYLNTGDRFYQKKDYENALKNYLDALTFDTGDPRINFKLGVSYFHSEKITKAVPYLEKAFSSKPEVDPN